MTEQHLPFSPWLAMTVVTQKTATTAATAQHREQDKKNTINSHSSGVTDPAKHTASWLPVGQAPTSHTKKKQALHKQIPLSNESMSVDMSGHR